MFTTNEIDFIEARALNEKKMALLSSEELRKERYVNVGTLDSIAAKMRKTNKAQDGRR